jgi:hydroxyacylglutathione hydrolase
MTKVWQYHNSDGEYEIYQIPYAKNCFSYLISSHKIAISIDPGAGDEIEKVLDEAGLKLEAILVTHHHKAHVEDAEFLKEKTGATIIGPKHEDLEFVDQEVFDEDECLISPFTVKVLGLPGHTLDHIGYYFPDCKAFFSGDALFLGGCGKMIEGDEIDYFESMQKILRLPNETLIFGGHNILGEITVRTLEEEVKANPFLQASSAAEFLKARNEVDAL